MKRNIIFLLSLSIVLSFTGCSKSYDGYASKNDMLTSISSAQPSSIQDNNEHRLSEDDIRKNYKENEIKSVNKIGSDYLLIEWQEGESCNMFDLYNLKTGEAELLPTVPQFTKLKKIENENYFVFKALGKNHTEPLTTFPYYIKCFRTNNGADKKRTFTAVMEDRYYDIGESVEAGAKDECLMSDMNITFDGLEVMFKPMKGKESYFYAASTYIPSVKTIYDKESNKMTIVIGAEDIGSKLFYNKSVDVRDNPYFSTYQIIKKDGKINLVINLKESAKRYLIRISKLPVGENTDAIPYFFVKFAGEGF